MEELLKEFEDNGIEVKVGWKEKERKKLWVKKWKN